MQYQLLPDLTDEEFAALKADIAARGVMVPVELDETGAVLDGHHRVRACAELGITEYPRIIRPGMSEDEKREHVLALNLDRRHLSREQRRELVGRLRAQGWSLRRIADKLHVSHVQVGRDAGVTNVTPDTEPVRTVTGADGKQYAATRPTVQAPAPLMESDFSEEEPDDGEDWDTLSDYEDVTARRAKRASVVVGTPKQAARALELLDGGAEPAKPMATVADLSQAARRQAAAEREEEVKANAGQFTPTELLQLHHGDFQTVTADMPPESVDLIFTDPPYGREWLGLWDDLGLAAARLLKPDGLLVAFTGKLHFPYCMDALSANLTYHWLCSVGYEGAGRTVFGVRFWGQWRPLLVFRKGEVRKHRYAFDFQHQPVAAAADQSLHPWAQSDFAASYYIGALSEPGDTVLDPMCGTGTFVRTAAALGRRGVGIEADASRFEVCKGLSVEA